MRNILFTTLVLLGLLTVLCVGSVNVKVNVETGNVNKMRSSLANKFPSVSAGGCNNNPPKPNPGQRQYSCEEQKGWGKCNERWMRGFCEVTCGTCNSNGNNGGNNNNNDNNNSGVNSVRALGISAAGSRKDYRLNPYSNEYKSKKNRILDALKAADLSLPLQKLFLSIAMVETNSFDPQDRDGGKSGDSTNYSQFNINQAFLRYVGFNGNPNSLNQWSSLNQIVHILKSAVKQLGVNGFLNFHRGGETGFTDGRSYGCHYYRNSIASMMRAMDNNPSLMTDDRRIDIYVKHA
jgi:hypothetical protein